MHITSAKDAVGLPKTMSLMTLANRIGVSLEEVLQLYPRVNGHEVGYARTVIPYTIAKDIAAMLGKKLIRFCIGLKLSRRTIFLIWIIMIYVMSLGDIILNFQLLILHVQQYII